MSSDYETIEVKLLKQEDWPAWFDFIRSEATTAKIWRFVDPGEKNVPINVEPDIYYYTRDRVNTSTPSSTEPINETSASIPASTQPPVDPILEQYLAGQDSTGRWNSYKVKLAPPPPFLLPFTFLPPSSLSPPSSAVQNAWGSNPGLTYTLRF